ncbi:MAG TPA: hypothetical protein VMR25_17390 [Planctomycetaceae bacterium]|jgi:hypothetical protein|nr:hypothetical protein [Planctomycetaceae bacterium]
MIRLLAIFILVAFSCWSVVATFRRLCRIRSGWAWWSGFAVLTGCGLAAGKWLAFDFEYQVSPRTRFASFPIPLALFHLENGQWVDYISSPPIMYSGLLANVLAPVGLALLPLLLLSFIAGERSSGKRRTLIAPP